jgi:transcription initiation factor IIE alpha subunit
MSANTIWTADRIVNLLNTNNTAVERAIIALYNRQTADEKIARNTCHHNTVGFSAADAKTGTYLAKWLLSGKHLDGKFLAKGRNIAIKYRRQLSEIAAEKPAAS